MVLLASDAAAYDAKGRRDPMVPLVSAEGVLLEPPKAAPAEGVRGPLVLEGIVHDPHGPSVAVINGTVWQVGEVRDDVEVVAIEPSRVVVRHAGVQETLQWPSPDVEGTSSEGGVTGESS